MTESLLIKNVQVNSPADGIFMQGDILIKNGLVAAVGENLSDDSANIIDGTGLTALPGLVDIHVHLRDPGFTYKEDIITGCQSAAAGGVTAVCCMPNTKPATDSPEVIKYILEKAQNAAARVHPVASISKGLCGEEMTDFAALKAAGAVGLSDDGRPVENGRMMLDALVKGNENGLKVVSHCEDLAIINGGIMNEGEYSRQLGVKGMDRASEDSVTAREIALAAASGTPVHICHVSTKGSVELIRDAKRRGVHVTGETAPHYLFFTDEKLLSRDALRYRMNPPLRTAEDREALIEALMDGTIDAIATDHAPHSVEEKQNFEEAPNGVVGLETSFSACYTKLVLERGMSLEHLVMLMSVNPAKIMNIQGGSIAVGKPADIALMDLNCVWKVDPEKFHSKGRNTPFDGSSLAAKPVMTLLEGKVVYKDNERNWGENK
ncbi:MAG: dihydroorotase [Oscillospiraceae bacterium]|nr:dihydroorotase [Oscillospiraceae bacterium]